MRNELTCTYINLACVFLRTHNSTISFYVNLLLYLKFHFKFLIDRSGYLAYNSN